MGRRERRRLGRPIEEISDALSKFAFIGGSQLMIANPAGYVHQIDLSVDSWTARVCRIANRELSDSEVRQFMDGRPAQPCRP